MHSKTFSHRLLSSAISPFSFFSCYASPNTFLSAILPLLHLSAVLYCVILGLSPTPPFFLRSSFFFVFWFPFPSTSNSPLLPLPYLRAILYDIIPRLSTTLPFPLPPAFFYFSILAILPNNITFPSLPSTHSFLPYPSFGFFHCFTA